MGLAFLPAGVSLRTLSRRVGLVGLVLKGQQRRSHPARGSCTQGAARPWVQRGSLGTLQLEGVQPGDLVGGTAW